MRGWLTMVLIALGILAAHAMPVNQQIIIFGGQSSASGSSGGGGCASTGVFDISNVCNDIYLLTGSL